MKELHLNIVSPEKEVFNGEVKSVTGHQWSLFYSAAACTDCFFPARRDSQLHDNGWRRAYAGYSQRFCGAKQW